MEATCQNRNFTIRLDARIKEQAEELFDSLGMSLSGAVNIFLHQALIVRGLPFEVCQDHPNATTLASMKEALRLLSDPKAKRFSSVDELMEDLKK